MFLWEGNYLAQTPVRHTGCDLHRMSVTGNPFRHVRSEHSVAMKVAILFAYLPMSSLSWRIVVSTCKTRKLIYMTLFMLSHYIKTSLICHAISYDTTNMLTCITIIINFDLCRFMVRKRTFGNNMAHTSPSFFLHKSKQDIIFKCRYIIQDILQ